MTVRLEIFIGPEGEYYVRPPGSAGAICWRQDGDSWTSERCSLPGTAQGLEFADLPGALQEEVLAFVTRADAMGNQIWSAQN